MHREVELNSPTLVAPVVLPEMAATAHSASPRQVTELSQVEMDLTLIAGRAQLTLDEAADIGVGTIIALDRGPEAPADVFVNGVRAGSADVIVVDEHLAARIAALASSGGMR